MLWLWLWACKPPPTGPTHTGDTGLDRQWVEVSTAPCARDTEGLLGCWYSEQWKEISMGLRIVEPTTVPVREFSNLPDVMWGVREDGGWTNINYLAAEQPPLGLTNIRRATSRCALSGTEVVCWATSPSLFPTGYEYVDLHGELSSHAALTADNRLFIRRQGSPDQGYDFELDPNRELVKMVHVEPWDACVLGADGVVDCYGPGGTTGFDSPPYVDIAAGRWAVCAVRDTWEIDCNFGYRFDFGPIRTLEVTQESSLSLIYEGTPAEQWFPNYPQPGDAPNICVITQDNHVRCEGWKYDFPDLQRALP